MKLFDSENTDRSVLAMAVGGDTLTLTGTSGTADVTIDGIEYVATFDTDLDETSEDFKATHKAALRLRGIFTEVVGSVKQVDTVSVTGTSGTATIAAAGGLQSTVTWDTNLTDTCANFVTAYAAAYLAVGIVITSSVADIIFTSTELGQEFLHPTITPATGDLDGTVANTTAPASILVFSKKNPHVMTQRCAVSVANATGDLNGTVAATLILDCNTARVFQLAVSAPLTLAAPRNMQGGQYIRLEITTNANLAITWNAKFQFAGGTEPTQTSTALDILEGSYNKTAAKFYMTVRSPDVKA